MTQPDTNTVEDDDHDTEPTPICPVTSSYCTGQFCDDYGCAKKVGFYDPE